jgi:hypothetical protein
MTDHKSMPRTHFSIFELLFGNNKLVKKDEYKKGLQVIGSGFGRTGTSSLKKALEILYEDDNAAIYHMSVLIENGWAQFWYDFHHKKVTNEDIKTHFAKFIATTDNPSCLFWEQLLDVYPDAKIIHSTRSPESWYKSCTDTVFNFQPGYPNQPLGVRIIQMCLPFWRLWSLMMRESWNDQFFKGDYSKENCIKIFKDWEATVKSKCNKDKILIFDAKQGWEPICSFLNKPIPDVPFPHANDTAQMKNVIFAMNTLGYVMAATVVGSLAISVQYLKKKLAL